MEKAKKNTMKKEGKWNGGVLEKENLLQSQGDSMSTAEDKGPLSPEAAHPSPGPSPPSSPQPPALQSQWKQAQSLTRPLVFEALLFTS